MSEKQTASVIKQTQETLGKVIKKVPLNDKLLNRPPFKFIHDIIKEVIMNTNFMAGLYTPDELTSANVTTKEAKIQFLQKTIDVLGFVNGSPVPIKAGKVVAGLDAEATNQMLQMLGRFVLARKESTLAVRKVLKGEKPTAGSKPTENKQQEPRMPNKSAETVKQQQPSSSANVVKKSLSTASNTKPLPSSTVRKTSTSLKKPTQSNLSRRPSNVVHSTTKPVAITKKSPRTSPTVSTTSGTRTRPSSRSGSANSRSPLHRPNIDPVESKPILPTADMSTNENATDLTSDALAKNNNDEDDDDDDDVSPAKPKRSEINEKLMKTEANMIQSSSTINDAEPTVGTSMAVQENSSNDVLPAARATTAIRSARKASARPPPPVEPPESNQSAAVSSPTLTSGLQRASSTTAKQPISSNTMLPSNKTFDRPITGRPTTARPATARAPPPKVLTKDQLMEQDQRTESPVRLISAITPGTLTGSTPLVLTIKDEQNQSSDDELEAEEEEEEGQVGQSEQELVRLKDKSRLNEQNIREQIDAIEDEEGDDLGTNQLGLPSFSHRKNSGDPDKGALVRKLVQSRQQLEDNVEGVERVQSALPSQQDLIQLKRVMEGVQKLCRLANPTSKAIEYLQEEVEMMFAERRNWLEEANQNRTALAAKRGQHENELRTLQGQLEQLDEQIRQEDQVRIEKQSTLWRTHDQILHLVTRLVEG